MSTAERIKKELKYYPDTGVIVWAVDLGNGIKPGTIAGHIDELTGYRVIFSKRKLYQAHRIAWLLMMGAWPEKDIDHRDTNRTNNKWSNLREANDTQNTQNASMKSNNNCGIKGVSFHKFRKKFQAQIQVFGKKKHLGYFSTPEAAGDAYKDAAVKYFGEFARIA